MKTNKVIKLMVSSLSAIALAACSLLPEKKIYTEIDINTPKQIIWGGGLEGIFYGKHVFELLPLAAGVTQLVHKERFSGIAIPFAELGSIEEGYNLMNEALKKRAEAQYD